MVLEWVYINIRSDKICKLYVDVDPQLFQRLLSQQELTFLGAGNDTSHVTHVHSPSDRLQFDVQLDNVGASDFRAAHSNSCDWLSESCNLDSLVELLDLGDDVTRNDLLLTAVAHSSDSASDSQKD